MAWRIDDAVVRGEIDNRARGRVVGRIWLAGRSEPVTLDLAGDAWRDLAGRKLEFVNREPRPMDLRNLSAKQTGCVGDITASRKVKVPDIPLDQIGEYSLRDEPFPWHWGNSLYLEWLSDTNGRIVIESASYELRIAGETTWEMTEEEETRQREKNSASNAALMERLGAAISPEAAEDKDWNEQPQTEEEAEQMQERNERLLDRIEARLAREGETADYEEILEQELERMRRERGDPEPTAEDLARNAAWIDEMNRAAEESARDPEPEPVVRRKHPLAERALEFTLQLRRSAQANRWLPESATEEHPVAELINGVTKAAAKFAGALNSHEWPPEIDFCAGIVVRLKRARVYLDDSLRALESCQEQQLLDAEWLGKTLIEIVDLANDADEIIAELRARLEQGKE